MVNTLKKIINFVFVASCLLLSSCTTMSKTSVSDDSSSDAASTTSYLENATNTSVGTTTATVKDSESNVIKPNNAASDEEVDFLENAEQLVNSVEQIEELKRLLLEIEGVTDVQIYNSDDDSQNTELQIAEGKVEKGMVVKVFYDNGESWAKYTKQNSENFKINEDLISELGMTYLQLTEKYGESKGSYNVCVFENGYGGYVWKSYDGVYFEDMETAGGCNMIDGINMGELFLGLTYPISFDELANKYGFCIVSVNNEITMDERYWAELSYPKYDDISFIFATTEYGCIDVDTSACVIMNMDCLQAQPITIEQ